MNAVTGGEGPLPRVKPFKYTYEKEIVMYAYFKKLDYFSTECVYAPFAARGFARDFVKDLEVSLRSSELQPREPCPCTVHRTAWQHHSRKLHGFYMPASLPGSFLFQ